MTRSSSAASAAIAVVVAALLVPACVVHEGEPHPLYSKDEPRRPPAQTARLFGPIATGGFIGTIGQVVFALG